MSTDMTTLSQLTTDEVRSTIQQLHECVNWIPVEAIETIRQHRDQFTPALLEILKSANSSVVAGTLAGNAHTYALYVLAELDIKEALPIIVESLLLNEEHLDQLYSDDMTENLPRILAKLSRDRVEVLESLLLDERLSRYARWTPAIAMMMLAGDKVMTQNRVKELLLRRLEVCIQQRDSHMGESLLAHLSEFQFEQIPDQVTGAFEQLEIDPMCVRIEHFLPESELYAGNVPFGYGREESAMDDAIDELQYWFLLEEEYQDRLQEQAEIEALAESNEFRAMWRAAQAEVGLGTEDDDWPVLQIRNETPRIGRNDPCPCNSGKKYKKCCGGNS